MTLNKSRIFNAKIKLKAIHVSQARYTKSHSGTVRMKIYNVWNVLDGLINGTNRESRSIPHLPNVIELPVECAHGFPFPWDRVHIRHLSPVGFCLDTEALRLINLNIKKFSYIYNVHYSTQAIFHLIIRAFDRYAKPSSSSSLECTSILKRAIYSLP